MCKKTVLGLTLALVLAACGGSTTQQQEAVSQISVTEGIEVIYFHGKQRCITCNAIESLTKEVIAADFAPQVEQGKVRFRTVDISTKTGEEVADRYEVTWSSLYINQWREGQEKRHNLTEIGFAQAKNSPEQFKAAVKKQITELLD